MLTTWPGPVLSYFDTMKTLTIHVVEETDHLPLVSVMKKSLLSTPTTLQRFLLALHGYNFKPLHKANTQIPVTDTLSRKPRNLRGILFSCFCCFVFFPKNLPYTGQKLAEIRPEAEKSSQLSCLRDALKASKLQTQGLSPLASRILALS